MGRSRFSMVMWSAMIDNHRRRRSRSVFNDNNRCRSNNHRCRRRNRTVRIRCPRRWYRAHAASTPNPGSVIPVPILITGNPHAFPPAIVIFRNHRLHHYRFWRRRLNYYSRGRSYNISLLRREKYVIKIAEKYIDPTGIGSMIDTASRHMGIVAGAAGQDTSRHCGS